MHRILVDENLSPELCAFANELGHEAYHVARRGWQGLRDPALLEIVLREHFVFVTNNRDDFIGLIQGTELHPGLVVITENVRRARQIELFAAALRLAATFPDMVNRVIEVDGNGNATSYTLPILPI